MQLDPTARAVIDRRRASTPVLAADVPLSERRAAFAGTWRETGPAEVAMTPDDADGVPVRVYRAPDADPAMARACVVSLHGGGFVFGGLDTYEPQARRWAAATGATVVDVDYRRAPEHPFPAAPDDVRTVLGWLVAHADRLGIDPTRIALAGDSAGGNLALSAGLRLRDDAGISLRALVLLCPAVDPEASIDDDLDREFHSGSTWWWPQYLPTPELAADPYAAPARATSYAGLPPTLLTTVRYDDLWAQGVALGERLVADGVAVTLDDHADMFHVFHMYPAAIPAAARAQRTIADFLVAQLGTAG